jgi:glutamate N-acetyltransferase/amino-acid N-acetyltransferase
LKKTPMSDINIVRDGTVTSPIGFSAGGIYAGIKTQGEGKLDIGLLYSDRPCDVAGTFTRNAVVSPSVTVTKSLVEGGGTIRGVIANSGCANCAVGEYGFKDAQEMAAIAAAKLGVQPDNVAVASTGVIGVELPMALIRDHVPQIILKEDGGDEFARAILTTDTHTKHIAVSFKIGGSTITIGGVSKGAGMIHPNMATMLAFLTTDAEIETMFMRQALRDVVNLTFNQIDIDGDQSTNDTVLLMANGAAGNAVISGGDEASETFREALLIVAQHLAKEIARDGEGARTLIEATVEGAESDADARKAARSIASSLLVKTAVYGRDPNWGRILMALGKSEIALEESKIRVFINDIQIVSEGKAIAYNVQSVVTALSQKDVRLRVSLEMGEGTGTAWGCDLTEEYVIFNSAYTT